MEDLKYLSDVNNIKVLKVYEVDRYLPYIEIVYLKEGIEKSLMIQSKCHFGPMYNGCWFEISDKPIESSKKKVSSKLADINYIETINTYVEEIDNGAYVDLEIMYKNKEGEQHNYLLHATSHDEEVHQVQLSRDKESNYTLLEQYMKIKYG